MNSSVVVTIQCLVYNHAAFLRQCLDGFVMQKTTFKYEAIVHDDASTDESADIIREYAEKYPEIIKPIYEEVNQYSKHDGTIDRVLEEHTFGKYIALCEGDDYWTDPNKLQKQVDFLETHLDYVVCTHTYQIFNQDSLTYGKIFPLNKTVNQDYDLNFYIKRTEWVTQPLTAVYRRSALNVQDYNRYKNRKDVTFFYCLLKNGKGILLNDCMGVYRLHQGGVWTGVSPVEQRFAEFQTCLGIYEIDKDEIAAKMVKYRLDQTGYLGFRFLRKYLGTYIKIITIIFKEFGFVKTTKSVIRSLNYFHSYFGY